MYFDKSKKVAALHPDATRVLEKKISSIASKRKMS